MAALIGISDLKKRFLQNEALTLTINGALATRSLDNPVYSSAATDRQKEKLRNAIRKRLPQFAAAYTEGQVSEEGHITNLESLAKELTDGFPQILHRGKFRIGVTQKLLNLYLKYCWTFGWHPEPPHCPFDDDIIAKLFIKEPISWTELDSIEGYQKLVDAAHEQASRCHQSIASWELEQWTPV